MDVRTEDGRAIASCGGEKMKLCWDLCVRGAIRFAAIRET